VLVLPRHCAHVPLACSAPLLQFQAGSGVGAWEGRGPGEVRVLLAILRWERRLVRFLEMSGVGRVMVDGVDEDGAWAAQMDE